MIVAKIQVSGVRANVVYRKIIPTGIVGAQVELDYAEDIWHGLHKTVVFRGAVTKDVVADANLVMIPPEVVETTGITLQMGVYGVDDDGNLAIPTLWTSLGHVRAATNPSGDTSTDPSLPVWAQIRAMIGNLDALDTTAKNNLVAAVNEAMTKGGGEVDAAEIQRIVDDYLSANPPKVTETDPTVPDWAKQPQKPTYTADEVHALPDTYTPPNQTAQQVGADPAGTAASAVSQHNTDTAAHNDLRLALQELANRVNAALDSDDTTLDQMSEVVVYIKSNKALIDAITTSKVSVADIVNDLVTNVADKPLSAAQGVVLKQLIDALRNDKLDAAELTNAVNTALAQAKASGEFDGQDGATPNIQIGTVETLSAGSPATASMGGTPENPLLNLGIPQGASGSGGSGISVSGATVGQTVKIAAVDDYGVPTAWEPVDFPSGGSGGNLHNPEFLTAFSVTESDVKTIEVINGDIEYREVFIFFNIDHNVIHSQTTQKTKLIGRINDAWDVGLGECVDAMRAKYIRIDNMGMSENTDGMSIASFAGLPDVALKKGFSRLYDNNVLPYKPIKKVMLYLVNDTACFAKDLHISVYGVRL